MRQIIAEGHVKGVEYGGDIFVRKDAVHSYLVRLVKENTDGKPKPRRNKKPASRAKPINRVDWVPKIYTRAKQGAAARGLPFDLTIEDIRKMAEDQQGRCAVTGMRFSNRKPKQGNKAPWAPSLDRKDSSLGYSPANCRIVSVFANIAMSDWGDWVLKEACKNHSGQSVAHHTGDYMPEDELTS